MKKNIIWLLLLAFFCVFSEGWCATLSKWNGITVGSASGNINAINGKTLGTSAGNINAWNELNMPTIPMAFTDNFNRLTLTNWTIETPSSSWDIYGSDTLECILNATDSFVRYDTPTNTLDQTLSVVVGGSWAGSNSISIVLRDNGGTGWCYVVDIANLTGTTSTIYFSGWDFDTSSWSVYSSYDMPTHPVSGDAITASVSGTGASTTVTVKLNGSTVTTFTGAPGNLAETGKYLGLHAWAYWNGMASALQLDSVSGGDL